MNSGLRWRVVIVVLATLLGGAWAQTAPATKPAKKPARKAKTTAARKPPVNREVETLREAVNAQQQQMQQLRDELQRRDTALQQLQQQVTALQSSVTEAHSAAQTAAASTQQNTNTLQTVQTTVADLKSNATSFATTFQEEQKRIGDMEHPTAIHFRGITITPGGFIEAGGVFRNRNENASINSASGNFNIPLSGTTNSKMTEFRFDARQSRVSLLGEGKIGGVKVTGYWETDFLGAAPTANENQSNSFNLRQRQLFASAEFPDGVTFSGGQQWSLFTLNRKGMANRSEFLPMTINAQYVIGYDWARQPSLRVVKNFNNKTWVGFAVENPSTVLNVQGFTVGGTATVPPVFGFNSSPNATSPNGNFVLNNTPGANGVSTNVAPDLVGKLTFEPGWGHFEIKGVGRFFRDRFSGNNNTKFGGGAGVAAILPIVKSKLDFIAEGMGGSGIGRYGSGGGIDVTLRPDGTIAPIKSYHALAGPEVHIGKNLDIYAYGGAEYYQRHFFGLGGTSSVGYGSYFLNNTGCRVEQTNATALSCPNQTRAAYEITPGFWYRFYKGSAGTVQLGLQYSYSARSLWTGTSGAPTGNVSQVYSSFRYYLP